jgi:hypothetical protein
MKTIHSASSSLTMVILAIIHYYNAGTPLDRFLVVTVLKADDVSASEV